MLEKLLKIGRDSNSKVKRKFINWFIRRYYACEIDCASKISDSVKICPSKEATAKVLHNNNR